ncbi:polyprenol phosphomannose-dependent alpha 1,6 mannosyltransferase MptB [Streptomyces sp. NBC_01216]|uniref:polyprenol phosphomannose-dependent alpha 1,6 mannosyltransferase MptB n=1 Tax=unclassified Streptomyces TaxID=2593676 RepID=UPI002E11CBF4|nr:polyprenol phosphomannose-dependent alpha 1,6 mannosyltransferase MptB [Streptomyces sp. NBC_01216]
MWVFSASGTRWLGTVGSLAVAVGGWTAGTLPVRGGWGLWEPRGAAPTTAGTVLALLGLTLLLGAWWQYGRLLARGAAPGTRWALGTLAAWAAPLLLAPPLYSADVYSYLAQGAMVLEGHDVYGGGPSVLGPGDLGADAAASVGGHWTDTPAPYGPAFLVLARGVVALTGGEIVPAVLTLRLVALGTVALIAWAVTAAARGAGRAGTGAEDAPCPHTGAGAPDRPETRARRAGEDRTAGALWLAVLNPLLLIHVVGGLHNDGLMIGLMLGGVVLATRGRWVPGSVLVGLAMMIKSPAAVALLFIGVAMARGGGARALVKGLLLPGLVAAAVAAGATLAAGTGFGWLRTQSVAGTIHTALSVTSDLGLGLGLLLADDPEPVQGVVRNLGLLLALAVIAALAVRVLRGRTDPVLGLGLALLALVALSPMVQPWYLLWGVVVLAPVAWHTGLGRFLAVLAGALTFETQPSGHTPAHGFVLAGAALALGLMWMRREPWPPPPVTADGSAPGESVMPGGAVPDGPAATGAGA